MRTRSLPRLAAPALPVLFAVLLLFEAAGDEPATFRDVVRPFLARHCAGCHGPSDPAAGLVLADAPAPGEGDADLWRLVRERLGRGEMPPEGAPRPPADEVRRVVGWIEGRFGAPPPAPAEPGRVTLRRLNRTEYERTVLDLLGVAFDAAEALPDDDVGHGFDNVGDVLSLPPRLLEKYLLAAERIAAEAVPDPEVPGEVRRLEGRALAVDGGGRTHRGVWVLFSHGEVHGSVVLPREGEYRFRVEASADQAGPEFARMALRVDRSPVGTVEVRAAAGEIEGHEVTLRLGGGRHQFGAAFVNDYYRPDHPDPAQRDRNLVVVALEAIGPLDEAPPSPAERLVFAEPRPATGEEVPGYLRRTVERLARRAWRRPVEEEDLDRLLEAVEAATPAPAGLEARVRAAATALLVSPRFLFRVEPPGKNGAPRDLDDHELATRLSYFLWSSMPDDRLFALAEGGALADPLRREAEVRRMLLDPRATALAEHFAPQWLGIRDLARASPDPERFPRVNAPLLEAMQAETVLLFEAVLREDRDVRDLLRADFTFLNEQLASHYGVRGVRGERMRRVPRIAPERAGILTHASVLTATSNPTRTSPVKRGRWVLEALLDAPTPPPPPGVDSLEEAEEPSASLRERLARHRADAACAVCHDRLDPLGLALERYDAVGRWRARDESSAVEERATLPDGRTVEGPAALADLVANERGFLRSLARHLLTYAIGRGLTDADRAAVERLVTTLEAEPILSRAIVEITGLDAFRRRGGEER